MVSPSVAGSYDVAESYNRVSQSFADGNNKSGFHLLKGATTWRRESQGLAINYRSSSPLFLDGPGCFGVLLYNNTQPYLNNALAYPRKS